MSTTHELKSRDVTRFLQEHGVEDELVQHQRGHLCLIDARGKNEPHCVGCNHAGTEVFKIAPGLLNAPGVAAQFLRMVGEGSPQVEQMADSLMGNQAGYVPNNYKYGWLRRLLVWWGK